MAQPLIYRLLIKPYHGAPTLAILVTLSMVGQMKDESTLMKAAMVNKPGDYSAIQVERIPIPEAAKGQLLVQNHYSGVNYIDTYHRNGTYPMPFPLTLGREGAGVVAAVGEGVEGFAVGDRVAYIGSGSYAEYTAMPVMNVIKVPSGVSLEQAAASLLQAMTATYLLTDSYRVQKGDTVLVTGAAGGTGGLICQLAKSLGATVIGMCSAGKDSVALSNGAHHIVRPPSASPSALTEEVMNITAGRGCQVLYDGIGKDLWPVGLHCLAKRGHYINFGNASGVIESISPFDLTPKCRSFMRTGLLHYIETREEFLALAGTALGWVAEGRLHVTVHKVYEGLEQAGAAHRDLESRSTIGKLLIKIHS